MPIYSPRGCKIRFPVKYSFSLIERLRPEVNAYKVLQDVELWDMIPSCIGLVVAIICFVMKFSFLQIGIYVLIALVIGKIYQLFPLFPIILLKELTYIYLILPWFLSWFVIPITIGMFFVGWKGVIAYYMAYFVSAFISFNIEFVYTFYLKSKGLVMSFSEVMFLKIYLSYAKQLGRTEDTEVSDAEIETEAWQNAFNEYAERCPYMAQKSLSDILQ